MQLSLDGHAVEKYQAKFAGGIDLEEQEARTMALDRVVILLVAARASKATFEVLKEGDIRRSTTLAVSDAVALDGKMREEALNFLAGTGGQGVFTVTPPPGPTYSGPDQPEDGEVQYVNGVKEIYHDGAWHSADDDVDVDDEYVDDDGPKVAHYSEADFAAEVSEPQVVATLSPHGRKDQILDNFLREG